MKTIKIVSGSVPFAHIGVEPGMDGVKSKIKDITDYMVYARLRWPHEKVYVKGATEPEEKYILSVYEKELRECQANPAIMNSEEFKRADVKVKNSGTADSLSEDD